MPEEAKQAFHRLRQALLSAPVLTLPRPDRQFAVIVDAATGSETTTGGLGAILAQIDAQGKFHAVCYASRRLNKENQYSPFLLEMAAAVWAIKTFKDHLNGVRFILFTDHKPLQKLALAQSKTLNEFQQLALQFDFITQYKQGINMPAVTLGGFQFCVLPFRCFFRSVYFGEFRSAKISVLVSYGEFQLIVQSLCFVPSFKQSRYLGLPLGGWHRKKLCDPSKGKFYTGIYK
jgi:hypothetical protein